MKISVIYFGILHLFFYAYGLMTVAALTDDSEAYGNSGNIRSGGYR